MQKCQSPFGHLLGGGETLVVNSRGLTTRNGFLRRQSYRLCSLIELNCEFEFLKFRVDDCGFGLKGKSRIDKNFIR